jgi:Resolvase, N terminal domain
MKIGYVRVSKQEQNEELQIDALKEAGCDKWFLDKMTGSKAERKGRDLGARVSAVRRYLRGLEARSGRAFALAFDRAALGSPGTLHRIHQPHRADRYDDAWRQAHLSSDGGLGRV